MAQTVDQIYQSLNPTYDPYRALYQQQVDALPGQETAAIAAADTAKNNAFNDVTNQAVGRGALYSGVPTDQQNRYTGEVYAPKIAGIKADTLNNRSKLQLGLLDIGKEQRDRATVLQDSQVKSEQAAADQAYQRSLEERKLAASTQKVSSTDKKTDINRSLNADLSAAFGNFGNQPKYYTEQKVIPALVAAYPEIDQQQLIKTVYAYRKALGYN